MANLAFDIPINFKLYADTEDEAIFVLQKFLHKAIIEFGLDREILEHDVIEYFTTDPELRHGRQQVFIKPEIARYCDSM